MLNQLLAGVLLLLLPLLPLSGLAQDRNIAHDGFRFLNRDEPQLLEYPNLGIAVGLAQSPQGYAVMLQDVVPSGSLVSIWGKQLSGSAVTHVLLLNQGREWALKAEIYPQLWFGLEMCVFRLPSEIYGEVFVKAIGESRNSNLVRILVE